MLARVCPGFNFYPRPPRGGRPVSLKAKIAKLEFLSTPSARRATYRCAGRVRIYGEFLSTPSARRATSYAPCQRHDQGNFYPRPPRGGRPLVLVLRYSAPFISIHALREEGDQGGADETGQHEISIHALREEGDALPLWQVQQPRDFYPRPPRGGRRREVLPRCRGSKFLSTPSARRATREVLPPRQGRQNFYPRPPRGGRLHTGQRRYAYNLFLSTPSARRATDRIHRGLNNMAISIHALREEGDSRTDARKHRQRHFYPRPPRGGRQAPTGSSPEMPEFLSTPSARRATL